MLEKNPNVEVLEEYINAHTKILHKYKKCGHIANVPPSRILGGSGCDICNRKNVGKKFKKTTEQYKKELKNKNPEIEVLEDYVGANTKIKHLHTKCGTVWNVTPSSILCGTGCPKCSNELAVQKRTLSEEEFKKRIKPTINILSKYINNHTPVDCECKICNFYWSPIPYDLMVGKGCPRCGGNLKKTHAQFIKEVSSKLDPDISIIGEYIDAKTPILCYCNVCKSIFLAMPYNLQLGTGCKKCKDKSNGIQRRKSHDQFLSELLNITKTINVLGDYEGANKPIKSECLICGHIWYPIPDSLLHKYGCPKCSSSHGERDVQIYLDRNNITYIHQAKFDNLIGIGNRRLSYDFYIPQYNLLIECQGEQHERPVEYFGGIKTFIKQKIHDTRKRKYAYKHNIKLLEIWYYENNKIDKILEQTLNNLKSLCVETVTVA